MIKLQNNAQIHRSNFGNSRPSSNALLSRTYLNCHTTQTAPSYYFTAITLTFKRRINLQILGEKKKNQTSSTKFPETSLFNSCRSSVALWARLCSGAMKTRFSFLKCNLYSTSLLHILHGKEISS